MKALKLLILHHLKKADGRQVPEETLFLALSQMVRPVATKEQFVDCLLDLIKKEMIGFEEDDLTDERKFYIREKGVSALNP
jgi:hypothetical protein